ncbi:MAG: ABC transporter ATP-binding protein [Planctomycetota bacterium]|jgi:ABC-2 type transport system ATP-binding protein
MTEVLSVTGARKRFGATQALDGAELCLARGEWLGLLGPNGAGKTTLVRSITGRVRLDEGRVTLLGAPVNGREARADAAGRRLGIVPQEVAVYPLLTARENLAVFAALHGVASSEIRDRVAWALDWTGLGDRADEPTKHFSGGMKRRLNLACGIMHRPEVVLLDEPTVGVDPQSRQRIWEMLGQLRSDGASLLLTTHQLDEAERVCERIVIIDRGRAIAAGTIQALIDQTIGRGRQVTLTLDDAPGAVRWEREVTVEGRTVRAHVQDVAGDLAGLLAAIHDGGHTVQDVRVEAPSLHAVFLHLTGRELRE